MKKRTFKIKPGDVLVSINDRHDPVSSIERWIIGNPYEHVFVYLGRISLTAGQVKVENPMLFESAGRGVVIQTLSNRYGQKVAVMRLKSRRKRCLIPNVIEAAIKLASEPQAYYDYMCIVRYVLPKLICEKLHLPIPLAWHRDKRQICSEAVFEIFYRAGIVNILEPDCQPPMPGDFVLDTPILEKMDEVILSEECV